MPSADSREDPRRTLGHSITHNEVVTQAPVPVRDDAPGPEGARPATARAWAPWLFVAIASGGLIAGAVLWVVDAPDGADVAWALTTVLGIAPAVGWVVTSLRRRRPGVDLIAVLALAGALAVGEYFAGALITVMLATGRLLEALASARADRELRALLERAPRTVHRYEGSELATPPLDAVRPGDRLLIRSGEVVPVDGRVESTDEAVLDESALTGEALPVSRPAGDAVRSGVVNAGAPFDLRVTTTAEESTYAGIVRMVASEQAQQAPFARLADRYAVAFVPLTLVVAGAAWLVSGDPVRAVAVLVVATPCPLILAAPVAVVSGMSRMAARGVIAKGGSALERLAGGRVLLFDKTGTITQGRPAVAEIVTADDAVTAEEALRLAASLEQVSPHVLASAVVRDARARRLELVLPTDVDEVPGRGVRGLVDGHAVAVGRADWIADHESQAWIRSARRRAELDGSITVFVGVDGTLAACLLLDDPVRADAARTIRALRQSGIERVVMVTGDRAEVAESVAAVCDIDDVLAERSPADKVEAVMFERRNGATIMVGDGINDAPALAAADVGVAVGARGSTASSEAADVVLSVDRLDRLGDAIRIAQRALGIARQSVVVGMGLSLAAMGFAAAGVLPPAVGAILQEGIDIAVILNALRVLGGGAQQLRLEETDAALGRRFGAEHQHLRVELEGIRDAADALGVEAPADALRRVQVVHLFLVDELLPHEMAEDSELYPVLNRVLGGHDATGTMSRTHAEISHLVRRLGRLLDEVPSEGPDDDDILELRRVLYGLHAILKLHFAQEEQGYFSLIDDPPKPAGA